MDFHHSRRGTGKPLLLIHGLGSSQAAWNLVGPALAEAREVIAIDLPGHGGTAAQADSTSFSGLARSLEEWIGEQGLRGADMVGSSLGGQLVLEMARRGRSGAVVALDPGGFWEGWERQYIYGSLTAMRSLLTAMGPALPIVTHTPGGRTALLAQMSARPWALSGDLVQAEMETMVATQTFHELLKDLSFGPTQEGPAARGSGRVTIGWGRQDRLTLPVQAERAVAAFPGARLHWLEHSGHYPLFDEPDETVALIRSAID